MTEGLVVSVAVQFGLSLFPVCVTGPSSTKDAEKRWKEGVKVVPNLAVEKCGKSMEFALGGH